MTQGQMIVIDGFYPNPDFVRDFALGQDFNVVGNYPGARTEAQTDPYFQNQRLVFEKILNRPITYWASGYNTAFQVTTEENRTWIHHDATEWAAVVYLTPNPVTEAGTAIFRHMPTGIFKDDENAVRNFNDDPAPIEEWEVVTESKNIYNRAVIYHGRYYHSSVKPGFGKDKYDGRLFQTFFFDT